MQYYRFVVPIKIYSLHYNETESFLPSLPLFLFDWIIKGREIAKEILINCNSLYLLQMQVNMIASSVRLLVAQ